MRCSYSCRLSGGRSLIKSRTKAGRGREPTTEVGKSLAMIEIRTTNDECPLKIRMTNDEIRKESETRMTKDEHQIGPAVSIRHSDFGFLSDLVIRHSEFLLPSPISARQFEVFLRIYFHVIA